jgi:hypothetical protein
MHSYKIVVLVLVLRNSSAKEISRRSLSNIFNRTSRTRSVEAPDTSSIVSTNVTNMGTHDDHIDDKVKYYARYETNDSISQQRRRRLGVGARYTRSKPSDDFIRGNENMHRFFDNMLMSMVTKVRFLTKMIMFTLLVLRKNSKINVFLHFR